MKKLTSAEIFDIIWNAVRGSRLHAEVPMMYADHYPVSANNEKMSGEFIVISQISNAIGDIQVSTVNVNIYTPDSTPSINRSEQRYPNRKRLGELALLAYEALSKSPLDERYTFEVQSETVISERELPYSFLNVKVQLKNY